MREQLIQYVELLFAGARDCEDIKQEILQNTLDRYDDLIAEGKVPEAAYRLAITGIGDISEILGTKPQPSAPVYHAPAAPQIGNDDTPTKKLLRAIAVGLYILCPVPLIALTEIEMEIIGLCGTLVFVAVATMLLILGGKKSPKGHVSLPFKKEEDSQPKSELSKSVSGMVWAAGLALYFLISFTTGAWYITWVIFPILGALDKLLCTILQNKEAMNSDIRFPSKGKLRKSINGMIWAVGLALYFLVGFATGGWYTIWLFLPLIGAVQGLVKAILDLKEVMDNEE